jgi:tetraacyldisaccharide 4'-kinase
VAGLTAEVIARVRPFERYWYSRNALAVSLLPLSWLFRAIVAFRRGCYRLRNRAMPRASVPVVVVGNISIGGTGKTPLVIWLAELLKARGHQPGIISRGYGGRATRWPQLVSSESDPALVGDEPVVIARRTGCPMAVGPRRVEAAQGLLSARRCDVLISDDGLQHYALTRDVEIAVIDGERGLGNGWCLPAGPLREPISRLREVDFVVTNGVAERGRYAMSVSGDEAVNLRDAGLHRPLQSFVDERPHAVAGIGNPARFFAMLARCGLAVETHAFPDHHRYATDDLEFGDERPVLMTEKDAVKCRAFARPHHWYVPVSARLDERFAPALMARLRARALAEVQQPIVETN